MGAVTKHGGGKLTLAGPNTYCGPTTISSGTSTLPATGNLMGAGTLSGNGKTLAVLGSFLPGNSPGTVTLGPGFTLDLTNSGSSVFEITNPRYTPVSYDRVNDTGSAAVAGGTGRSSQPEARSRRSTGRFC